MAIFIVTFEMKNSIWLSLLLSFSIATKAQLLVGPVAGGGISWVSFHDKKSRDFFKQVPIISYQGGVDISFQVRKNFYLHTALLYSRKGKSVSANAAPDLKHLEIYHHLDVPIVFTHEFKFKVGQNKIFKLYMGMGPNVSYWLNGKGSLTTSQLLEDQTPVLNYTLTFKERETYAEGVVPIHDANRWQLGLNLASGAVFEPWGGQKIHLSARYELGHSYLAKSGATSFPGVFDYSADLKARNMGLRFSVSYLIDLKPSESKRGKSTADKTIKRKRKN